MYYDWHMYIFQRIQVFFLQDEVLIMIMFLMKIFWLIDLWWNFNDMLT
jgi:hypothetical protein